MSTDQKTEVKDRPLPILYRVDNGVAILKFNLARKLNAWTPQLIENLKGLLNRAGKDEQVKAAVITGTGRYYSAGVDFGGSFSLKLPSAIIAESEKKNYTLFDAFISFPKPLICALNGPAIGAAATSSQLCDSVVALDNVTLHTPFVKLSCYPLSSDIYYTVSSLSCAVPFSLNHHCIGSLSHLLYGHLTIACMYVYIITSSYESVSYLDLTNKNKNQNNYIPILNMDFTIYHIYIYIY